MKNICVLILLGFFLWPLKTYSQKFWSLTYEFRGGPKTGIVLSDDTVLYAGIRNGILKSFDEGNHFEKVMTASSVVSLFMSSSGILYAGGKGIIYSSRDEGNNWDSVAVNSVYPVKQFAETKSGGLFAITGLYDEGDGVFYSADKGMNWENRNYGMSHLKGCERIAVDKNDRIYLAVSDEGTTGKGGLYISDNSGLLWEKVTILHDSISNPVTPGVITGLTISPADTVYISFIGKATNFLIELNLRKSIDDIKKENSWLLMSVANSFQWWIDRALNNIHFASNGDWYSSHTGSLSMGATYYSKDSGKSWERKDDGLGSSETGLRTEQQFVENSKGIIYMVQYLDERIYKTDNSLLTSSRHPVLSSLPVELFPNPVRSGEKVQLNFYGSNKYTEFYLCDASGKILAYLPSSASLTSINAPHTAGVYFLIATGKNNIDRVKFLVTD